MPGRVAHLGQRRLQFATGPSRTAGPIGMPLMASGVNRNIGRMKTKYQQRRQRPGGARVLAERRVEPEQRVEAEHRLAGLRRGGHTGDDEDQRDHAAEIAEPPGDVGDAADLALGTSRGIIELLNTVENSAATEASEKNSHDQEQASSRVRRTTAGEG